MRHRQDRWSAGGCLGQCVGEDGRRKVRRAIAGDLDPLHDEAAAARGHVADQGAHLRRTGGSRNSREKIHHPPTVAWSRLSSTLESTGTRADWSRLTPRTVTSSCAVRAPPEPPNARPSCGPRRPPARAPSRPGRSRRRAARCAAGSRRARHRQRAQDRGRARAVPFSPFSPSCPSSGLGGLRGHHERRRCGGGEVAAPRPHRDAGRSTFTWSLRHLPSRGRSD